MSKNVSPTMCLLKKDEADKLLCLFRQVQKDIANDENKTGSMFKFAFPMEEAIRTLEEKGKVFDGNIILEERDEIRVRHTVFFAEKFLKDFGDDLDGKSREAFEKVTLGREEEQSVILKIIKGAIGIFYSRYLMKYLLFVILALLVLLTALH